MAQVIINNSTYTQLNTASDAYLIQNTTGSPIKIAIAGSLPAPTASGFIINHGQAIGNSDFEGLCWGITTQPDGGSVEVAE